jgi:hypothetical protein
MPCISLQDMKLVGTDISGVVLQLYSTSPHKVSAGTGYVPAACSHLSDHNWRTQLRLFIYDPDSHYNAMFTQYGPQAS